MLKFSLDRADYGTHLIFDNQLYHLFLQLIVRRVFEFIGVWE